MLAGFFYSQQVFSGLCAIAAAGRKWKSMSHRRQHELLGLVDSPESCCSKSVFPTLEQALARLCSIQQCERPFFVRCSPSRNNWQAAMNSFRRSVVLKPIPPVRIPTRTGPSWR